MMGMYRPQDKLPEPNQYVLVHVPDRPWLDDDDPEGNRFWRVAKFMVGISLKERAALSLLHRCALRFTAADQHGNNHRPYCWIEFGPDRHFGQDVDLWCELPILDNG